MYTTVVREGICMEDTIHTLIHIVQMEVRNAEVYRLLQGIYEEAGP